MGYETPVEVVWGKIAENYGKLKNAGFEGGKII